MISLWWEILKNAKLSGKAKGTSFDASKININLDKNDCKERLRKLIWFNTTEPAREEIQEVNNEPRNVLVDNSEFNKLPERVACNILERMKSMDLNNLEDIKPLMNRIDRIKGNYKEWKVGEGYRLWLDIDEYPKIKVVRYYILNGNVDAVWIMFPFSDIKKWMAAL